MATSDSPPNSTWLDMFNATTPGNTDAFTATDYEQPPKCTFDICGFDGAYFAYRPSKVANLAFAVLFGISASAFVVQGIARKRWPGFTIAMALGCIVEVAGYVARVLAHDDLYSEVPFLVQIICLTIAPAILAAGVYLCLSRIVRTFGQDNSRISARAYPVIFVSCDIVSLILQAGGGGYASVKTHNREDPKVGNNIMIAGLSVQVFTLLVFMLLALDFANCTIRRIRKMGAHDALDRQHANLRKSWQFKGFLVALSLSTLCIFTRCVFRVAELSNGWEGHLMKKQNYFLGLEGAVILVAVFSLNLFHPGFCFWESSHTSTTAQIGSTRSQESISERTWYGCKKRGVTAHSNQEELWAKERSRGWGSTGSGMQQCA